MSINDLIFSVICLIGLQSNVADIIRLLPEDYRAHILKLLEFSMVLSFNFLTLRDIFVLYFLDFSFLLLDYFEAILLVGDRCHEKSSSSSFPAKTWVVILLDDIVFVDCASFTSHEIFDIVYLGLNVGRLLFHNLLLQCIPKQLRIFKPYLCKFLPIFKFFGLLYDTRVPLILRFIVMQLYVTRMPRLFLLFYDYWSLENLRHFLFRGNV